MSWITGLGRLNHKRRHNAGLRRIHAIFIGLGLFGFHVQRPLSVDCAISCCAHEIPAVSASSASANPTLSIKASSTSRASRVSGIDLRNALTLAQSPRLLQQKHSAWRCAPQIRTEKKEPEPIPWFIADRSSSPAHNKSMSNGQSCGQFLTAITASRQRVPPPPPIFSKPCR